MIGIIVAMTVEREAIEALLEEKKVVSHYGQDFWQGRLHGHEILLAECGLGKVASAITCARLIEHFGCDTVINIGTAGGLSEEEEELDVVVVDRSTYHDWDEEATNGRPRGFSTNNGYIFHSDEKLLESAVKAVSEGLEGKVHIGPIVSGDGFVSDKKLVRFIKKMFPEAIACDMESAAIGQVCTAYGVPFIIVRSLSDIVIKEGNYMDFEAYKKRASERAALFTEKLIERLI